MDDSKNNKPKRNRIQRSTTRRLRDARAIAMAVEGKTQKEIAGVIGVDRTTVGRILSSSEVKQLLKLAESRVNGLIESALDTVEKAMTSSAADMTNGLKASLAVLKSVGVIRDKIDLEHSFPKPTIINKLNGDQVILGASRPDESDEDYVA